MLVCLTGFNSNHLNLLDAAVVAGINVSEVGPFLPVPSEFPEIYLTIYIILLQEPVTKGKKTTHSGRSANEVSRRAAEDVRIRLSRNVGRRKPCRD